MEVSIARLVDTATHMQQVRVAQTAQMLVLKKAMDIEAPGALTLLQALPASLPLATRGSLGTQLNTLA